MYFKTLTILYILLTMLWGTCAAGGEHGLKAGRDPTLSGFTFTDNLLFEGNASSKLQCATQCSKTQNCVAFTHKRVTSVSGVCRGHGDSATAGSRNVSPGTELYVFQADSRSLGVQVTTTPVIAAAVTTITAPVTSTPMTSTSVASTPVTSAPVTSTPVTSTPVTSTPVTTTPVTPTPVTTTPVTSTPVTSTSVTTTPATTTPTTTTPVTSTPVTSTPMATDPLTSTPVTSAPVTSIPVTSTPVTTTHVTSIPVTTTPVTSTPVTSTSVTTTPVTTTQVTSTPVTSTPATTTPATTTPATTSSVPAADWLDSACSVTHDCLQVNSICFKSKCACLAGFYYSVGRKDCTADCSQADLQDRYQLYDGMGLRGHNEGTFSTSDEAFCRLKCSEDPRCLHFEISPQMNVCYIGYDSVLQFPGDFQAISGFKHFNRMCA